MELRFALGRTIVLFAGMLVLSSCAIVDSTDDGMLHSSAIEGYLSLGFEDSTFLPCSAAESWWVISDPTLGLWEKYQKIVSESHTLVYAVLRGTRSVPGSYGHLDAYDREFLVTDVVRLRERRAEDCRWPGEGES